MKTLRAVAAHVALATTPPVSSIGTMRQYLFWQRCMQPGSATMVAEEGIVHRLPCFQFYVCLCLYLHTCNTTCSCVHKHIRVYTHMHTYMCVCAALHPNICTSICIQKCLGMYICVCCICKTSYLYIIHLCMYTLTLIAPKLQ